MIPISDFRTVKETAVAWGVTVRYVNLCIAEGRVPGAVKAGYLWLLPVSAKKPTDRRKKESARKKSLSEDLADVIAQTTTPMPHHRPDAILDTVHEERLRLQYEGELAYLRGDFAQTLCCYRQMGEDHASRLRAAPLMIAVAISLGDYSLYTELETYLREILAADQGADTRAVADLALNTAYVSAIAPNMVSQWLRDGDFSALPPAARPDAAYKRTKYFQSLAEYAPMLAVAQTALAFSGMEGGVSLPGLYLRLSCAAALSGLDRQEEAGRCLLEAMRIALPHGFITPFAESLTGFGGLAEKLLEREFPAHYGAVTGQWDRTFVNWLTFHNHFTKENITLILSLREFQLAQLVAARVPYAKIAKQFHISVGTLNNIMRKIYSELFVKNREELSKYVL